jgi:hypothetical protein
MSKQSLYKAVAPEGYKILLPKIEGDSYRICHLLNGSPLKSDWVPFEADVVDEEPGRVSKETDAPWFTESVPAFSKKAVELMEPYLTENGEIFEVRTKDEKYFIYHAFVLDNALDKKKSSIITLPSGNVAAITKYVFDKTAVRGVKAFKIDIMKVNPVIFNEEFVKEWNKNQLQGLEFSKIWEG